MGGSPGLVVMGGDSYSKGGGFESWRCILVGHNIFHLYLLWEMFEKTKINKIEAEDGPLKTIIWPDEEHL